MADLEKAIATQLANIEKRSGKSLDELAAIIRASGLAKHGDANTLTHHVLKSDGQSAVATAGLSVDDVVAGLYTGPKASLRPIHDKLMEEITKFGAFEIATKKTYVSLRRKKQFAMIGPATKTQVEVGLNVKGLAPAERLVEQPPNSMCNYKVRLSEVAEVDATLIAWIKRAFESAG
jgi:predicted transport protein